MALRTHFSQDSIRLQLRLLLPAMLVFVLGISSSLDLSADEKKTPKHQSKQNAALDAVLAKKYPTSLADLKQIEKQVRKVVDQVRSYTVGVRVGSSHGSGVIVSEDGYVLTAGHVSAKPNVKVVFVLNDGREVKGITLGLNHGIDSGLMKITDKGKWPFAKMAKGGVLKEGQWCIATGHPGGYVPGRTPVVRLGRVLFFNSKAICTDCTLVGGDSGGPLFNLDGEVIGINSRIGFRITTNYHVPIATYHDTWDRLVAGEMWGGSLAGSTASIRPLVGIAGNPSGKPCRVTQVFPSSPAQKAGFQVGDIIQKFDGKAVENFSDLALGLKKKKPGQKISIELLREKKPIKVELVLSGMHGTLPGGPQEK